MTEVGAGLSEGPKPVQARSILEVRAGAVGAVDASAPKAWSTRTWRSSSVDVPGHISLERFAG